MSIKQTLSADNTTLTLNIDGVGGLTIKNTGAVGIPQFTTAAAPAYFKGGMYFDTTLNKLRIGGATAWETVTSV